MMQLPSVTTEFVLAVPPIAAATFMMTVKGISWLKGLNVPAPVSSSSSGGNGIASYLQGHDLAQLAADVGRIADALEKNVVDTGKVLHGLDRLVQHIDSHRHQMMQVVEHVAEIHGTVHSPKRDRRTTRR